MSHRSVLYTSSPLLASKTPLWRSKFIVAMVALGFVGLGVRAAYVQVISNDFYQRQGEVRFARKDDIRRHRPALGIDRLNNSNLFPITLLGLFWPSTFFGAYYNYAY